MDEPEWMSHSVISHSLPPTVLGESTRVKWSLYIIQVCTVSFIDWVLVFKVNTRPLQLHLEMDSHESTYMYVSVSMIKPKHKDLQTGGEWGNMLGRVWECIDLKNYLVYLR